MCSDKSNLTLAFEGWSTEHGPMNNFYLFDEISNFSQALFCWKQNTRNDGYSGLSRCAEVGKTFDPKDNQELLGEDESTKNTTDLDLGSWDRPLCIPRLAELSVCLGSSS